MVNAFRIVTMLCISPFLIYLLGCAGTLEKRTIHENTLVSQYPPITVRVAEHIDFSNKKQKSEWLTLPTGESVLFNFESYHFINFSIDRSEPRGRTIEEMAMEIGMGGPPKFVGKSLTVRFIKSKKHFFNIDDWVVDAIKNTIEEVYGGLKFKSAIWHIFEPQKKNFPAVDGLVKTYWREYGDDEKTVMQITYYESLRGSGIERKTWLNLEHLSLAQRAFLRLFEKHALEAFDLYASE